MYIAISILFIVICFLFLSLKAFKKVNQKYEKPISFLLTVIATFIGVFIAIAFSNHNEHNIDRSKTVKLLEISGYELGQIKMECDMSQSILDADSTIDIDSFILANPISRPEIFANLMNNELFIRNVSLPTFQALSRVNKNIQKIYHWVQADEHTVNKVNIFQTISNIVFYTQKIIATEIAYLNNEIKQEDLERLNEEHVYELLNITKGKLLEDFGKRQE